MSVPTIGIIMAGGSGERFWPVSRKQKPKQLLKLTGTSMTLLEEAVDRLLPIIPPDYIYIATTQALQEPIRAAKICIPPENILAEPARRNTTGCLAYTTAHLLARYGRDTGDLVMAITTADHRIGDADDFRRTITASVWFAREKNAIMVVGLLPNRPETGYGYIEVPPVSYPSASINGVSIYPTTRFREKPSRAEAENYVASGRFYWNSGMFFWRLSNFLKALQRFTPDVHNSIFQMRDALATSPNPDAVIAPIFEKLPNLSIDYAIMEKADGVYMALGEFPWDDVGLWDSLSRYYPKDINRNVSIGNPVLVDCRDVTVLNEPGAERMAVGVVGLENVIVVATEDGILVCHRDHAQDVRAVVEKLKERNASQI